MKKKKKMDNEEYFNAIYHCQKKNCPLKLIFFFFFLNLIKYVCHL